ncbi:MAG: hypothetical protein E5Y32_21165 [Mesorhizobium sp.]|nr:MAG: hypothetical protein E5Y32_21165 [Mesorhizobium sp.]
MFKKEFWFNGDAANVWVQTILAAFLAAIGVYTTVPPKLLWALGILAVAAIAIQWWLIARTAREKHNRSETLASVLMAMSFLATAPVPDQAHWEEYLKQWQTDNPRWNKDLAGCLTKAELASVFSPGVSMVNLHGSFNQQHNDIRATLHRWIDQLGRLA